MTNYYEQLNERRSHELANLAQATSDEARARVQRRLDTINALRADWQSRYGVPRPCECLR